MLSIDIFCNVIDNYGDAGVCLRLARALAARHTKVRLFCDDLKILRTIQSPADDDAVDIQAWDAANLKGYKPSAVVIRAFSCTLSEILIDALRQAKTLVINLEYLSAETWVEDCHTLSSPADGLNCFYFFPGFTPKTGGLLIEDSFKAKLSNRANTPHPTRQVTLFSYENKGVEILLSLLQNSSKPSCIKVFAGKGLDNLNQITGFNLKSNDEIKDGKILIKALPMTDQHHYDDYLLQSDLNCVRGEDSVVRAMLCAKPFLWQIYPQEQNAHLKKLQSMLDCMQIHLGKSLMLSRFSNLLFAYNNFGPAPDVKLDDIEDDWLKLSQAWTEYLLHNGSLADNLLNFCCSKMPG